MNKPRQIDPQDDRLNELAEILAAGLQRVLAQKSSEQCAECGESSLPNPPDKSGDPTPMDRRTSDA